MTEIFSERIFPLWTDDFFGRGGSDYAQQPGVRSAVAVVSHADTTAHPLDPGDIMWGTEKPEDDGDKVTAFYRFNLAEPSNQTNGPRNTPDFGDKILSAKIVFVADTVLETPFDSHIFCAARDDRWNRFDGTGASANPIFNNRGFYSLDFNGFNTQVLSPAGVLIDGPGEREVATNLFHDMARDLSFGVQRIGFSFRVTTALSTAGIIRQPLQRVGDLTGKFAYVQIFESEFSDGENDAPAEGAVELGRSDLLDMAVIPDGVIIGTNFFFFPAVALDPTKRYAAIVTAENTDFNNYLRYETRSNFTGVQSQVIAMATNQVAPNNAAYLNSGINTTNYFDSYQYPQNIGDDGRDLPGTLRTQANKSPGGVAIVWPTPLAGPIVRDTPGFAVVGDEYEIEIAELIQELVYNPLWSGGANGPDPQILLIGLGTKGTQASQFRAAKVARLHISWLHHDQVCTSGEFDVTPRTSAKLSVSPRASATLDVTPRTSAKLGVEPRTSASLDIEPRCSATFEICESEA